ncbi:LOW QUALITY PROTEIN: hypothetical protein PHMEG_00016475 [Phytophthora megakarya]|uniref:Uncharacterized protein n=1 Tax=Phytophthora megakarya TaxID=4795 RepID=A0A225W0E9_9STRA|nr:LOW QUALITY PROTEIN: hypothetical protein PHMEG_00016475 [Phytophthora megakarya]
MHGTEQRRLFEDPKLHMDPTLCTTLTLVTDWKTTPTLQRRREVASPLVQGVYLVQIDAAIIHQILLSRIFEWCQTYLCNVHRDGRPDTCFTIWHSDRNNGNDIPQLLLQEHKTRDRPRASRPGKKRARRLQVRQNEDADLEANTAEPIKDVNASPSSGGEGTVAKMEEFNLLKVCNALNHGLPNNRVTGLKTPSLAYT